MPEKENAVTDAEKLRLLEEKLRNLVDVVKKYRDKSTNQQQELALQAYDTKRSRKFIHENEVLRDKIGSASTKIIELLRKYDKLKV
ncbi:MAG: hypothetical protein WC955_02015 [Elusimicrobiota bacterium]